jgi:FG-GAP repeat
VRQANVQSSRVMIAAIMLVAGLALVSPTPAAASTTGGQSTGLATGDFNGDGRDDMAAGVPLEDLGGMQDAGIVHVVYGSAEGLDMEDNEVWHQNKRNIKGTASENVLFGATVAAGDFNRDGFDDLAVGATGYKNGAVHVIFGSDNGLRATNNQLWHQNRRKIADKRESGDGFGEGLVTGNFGRSQHDDLAITVANENLGAPSAGAVHVIYGSTSGLRAKGDHLVGQATPGVGNNPESSDRFGFSLAAGNFGESNHDDLAVGAAFEGNETLGFNSTGIVHVFYGSSSGIKPINEQTWTSESPSVGGDSNAGDFFGWSLAAANFAGSNKDELAIGVAGDAVDGDENSGAVTILRGNANGLSATLSEYWTQESATFPGESAEQDFMGASLGAGDFGGNDKADLAVGIPYDEVGAINAAGSVVVMYGLNDGFEAAPKQVWTQDSGTLLGVAAESDLFGSTIGAGEFGNNFGDPNSDDLLTGNFLDDILGADNAGTVNIIYSSGDSLLYEDSDLFSQDKEFIKDESEENDRLPSPDSPL